MRLLSAWFIVILSLRVVAQNDETVLTSETILYEMAENEQLDLNKTVDTGIVTIKRAGKLLNITAIDQRLQLENPGAVHRVDILEKDGLFYLLNDGRQSPMGYSLIKRIYSNGRGDIALFLKHPHGNQLWLNGLRQRIFFDDIEQFYFNSELQKFNGVASYDGHQVIIQDSTLMTIPYKRISNLIRDSQGDIYYYEAIDLYHFYKFKNRVYSPQRYKKGELLYLSNRQEITLIKKSTQQYVYGDGIEIAGPYTDLIALYAGSSDDTIFLLRQREDQLILEQLNLVI